MAIDINEVYQTVLNVLNKEQRGYIPPAEFNKLAEQSQSIIFEKYFEDLNQALRMPDNDSEYGNRVKTISDKINFFEMFDNLLVNASGVGDLTSLSKPVHRLGTIEYNFGSKLPVELEQVTSHEFNLSIRSKLTAPTSDYPIFYINGTQVKVSPEVGTGSIGGQGSYTVRYVRKPVKPQWNYTLGQVGNYVFNPTNATNNPSVDFEISSIDKVELINTILTYCGIIIRDQQIIQSAASMVMQENQNEKS